MKIKKYIKEMLTSLEEIDSANDNISTVISEVNILDAKYQRGQFDFKEYTKLKNTILASRTKNQVVHAYNAYIDSIKNNLAKLNSKILKTIYKDKSFENLFVGKGPKPKKSGPMLPAIETLEIGEYELPAEKAKEKKIEREIAAEKKSILREPDINIPLPEDYPSLEVPKPVNLGFFKRLIYAFQAKEKPWLDQIEQKNAKVWGIFSVDFLKYLFLGKEKRKGDVFGKTQISPSILSFEDKDRVERGFSINKSDVLDPYLLEKEIKELKHLISRKNQMYTKLAQ